MSKKLPKIEQIIADCQGHPKYSPYYLGYFKCFNQGLYYEAHDVLEVLWLKEKSSSLGNFYKGLIQFAGAFVHLQKDRFRPAYRLFGLALHNLQQYDACCCDLDLLEVCSLASSLQTQLENHEFEAHPIDLQTCAPKISLSA